MMSRPTIASIGFAAVLGFTALSTRADDKSLNPQIRKLVDEVAEAHIRGILEKLVGFGTRNTLSITDDAEHGIGAARQWIFDQFKSYSPRLEVRFDKWRVKKQGRIFKDVDLYNVIECFPERPCRKQW